MFKRTIAVMTILAVMLCLGVKVEATDNVRHTPDDEWLIYWYVCGTDLEEDNSQATTKIQQMEEVQLPPNVKVLIYANGAVNWQHQRIDKKGPGIYLYSSNSLDKLSSWKADMGSSDTLKKFLKFGEENFNPDHRILVFWDHGGVNGLCYDKAFDLNPKPEKEHHLTYDDLRKVFASVYGHSDKKPFELVGFDTCVSGSYELANSIADFSRYMVGSEPSENGWNYTYWLAALADDPAMTGASIGQAICDGNMEYYEAIDLNDKVVNAFSVINLNKMPDLRKAYEKYFSEAKNLGGAFARAASSRTTERYSDWYMDLGTLAENTKEILPEASENLLNAIHDAVSYNRPGAYLSAHGISTYYPYVTMNKVFSQEEFDSFLSQKSTPSSQKKLYKKLLKLDVSNLEGVRVREDVNGNIFAKLTPEQLENVSTVSCCIMPYVKYDDESVELGLFTSDTDLKIDWATGTFTENFQGNYPTIDGHKIFMALTVEGPLRDFYKVPIHLSYERELEGQQDEQGNPIKIKYEDDVTLQVAYNFETQIYEISGVGADVENGMLRTKKIELMPGDVITPKFFSIVSKNGVDANNGNVKEYVDPQTGKSMMYTETFGEPFTYTENSTIEFQPFDAGSYFYFFHFFAPNGNATFSWPVIIAVDENGGITKTIPTLENLKQVANEFDATAQE